MLLFIFVSSRFVRYLADAAAGRGHRHSRRTVDRRTENCHRGRRWAICIGRRWCTGIVAVRECVGRRVGVANDMSMVRNWPPIGCSRRIWEWPSTRALPEDSRPIADHRAAADYRAKEASTNVKTTSKKVFPDFNSFFLIISNS